MSLVRAVATVGGLTMVSRVLGFVRDVLIASLLGAGAVADAFFVAFRLPNLFRRLFAEGAFNAAFLPLFTGQHQAYGPAAARAYAGQVLAVMLVVLVPFTVLLQIAMPWVVSAIAPGFDDRPEAYALAVEYGRITFPYLMMMGLVALLSGVLNAIHKFAAAAAAPILLNIVLIAALVVFVPLFDDAGMVLAWGVAIAGIGQFLWLAIACGRADMLPALPRPRITPSTRRFGRLILPGAIGAGIIQINLWIGTVFASTIDGAVSWLYYADRVNQLPLGVIGIAVGVALLPMLSRQLRAGEDTAAMASQNRAIEFALFMTLPATAALVVIPTSLVDVLFERGAFTAADTAATAGALVAYAAGLPAYVLIKALQPGFFAREDTATPVKIAAASVAVNIALTPLLMWPWGHVGIALATAIAAWLNAGLCALVLWRRGLIRADDRLRRRLPRIVLASLIMAGLVWGGAELLSGWLAAGTGQEIVAIAVIVALGLIAYFVLARLTGAVDGAELRRFLRRRPRTPADETDA